MKQEDYFVVIEYVTSESGMLPRAFVGSFFVNKGVGNLSTCFLVKDAMKLESEEDANDMILVMSKYIRPRGREWKSCRVGDIDSKVIMRLKANYRNATGRLVRDD